MEECVVKKLGGSLYVTLHKKEGFKEGDNVQVFPLNELTTIKSLESDITSLKECINGLKAGIEVIKERMDKLEYPQQY